MSARRAIGSAIGATLLMAALQGGASPASAWNRAADPTRICRVRPFVFVVDQSAVGSAQGGPGVGPMDAAVSDAVDAWNATGSGWTGRYDGLVSSHGVANDINEAYFLRTWDPAFSQTALAITQTHLGGVGPEFTIREADLVYNGDRYDWSSGMPVPRSTSPIGDATPLHVTLHEVGHAMGIGHSEVRAAIMFPAGGVSDQLGADDVTAITTMYPAGEALCSADNQCVPSMGMSARCGPSETCEPTPAGELGAVCLGAGGCAAGLSCLMFSQGLRCTRECTEQSQCGTVTYCVATSGGTSFCFPPGPNEVGESCSTRIDCQTGICFGVCRLPCGDDDCDCPIGERCQPRTFNGNVLNHCVAGNSTCVRCGDGEIGGAEVCDDGPDNSDFDPDRCRTDCTAASCGDAVIDTDEACDDGNTSDGDGCSALCVVEILPDAGPQPDAGSDAGSVDAGAADVDAGAPRDAAVTLDAGPRTDAAPIDGGPGADAGDAAGDGGCSCRAAGSRAAGGPPGAPLGSLALLGLLALRRRRRAR